MMIDQNNNQQNDAYRATETYYKNMRGTSSSILRIDHLREIKNLLDEKTLIIYRLSIIHDYLCAKATNMDITTNLWPATKKKNTEFGEDIRG